MAPDPRDAPLGAPLAADAERERDPDRAQGAREDRPVAVTIVAHDINPVRGMERQLSDLVVGLRERGHEVSVIGRTCELPPGTEVAFHRVAGPARPFMIAYPWFMLAGSLAVARRRRGVVQATGAIVLNRVEAISVHYLHRVASNTPSRANPLFRLHDRGSRVLKRLGERICYRASRAAAFVCVSEGVAEELRRHFPAIAERVVTIYNGIDTEGFAPQSRTGEARELRAELGIDEQRLVAAFVGSEWERKGLEPLIAALALAPEWTLLVAGGGEELRYRRLAERAGVGAAVRWLGVRNDVERVYDLADAFVLPSSYETFSLVTFEAAASGLPILATPVNGVRELIVDGENGLLITREPDVIASRLRELGAAPEMRARLGAAARSAALGFGRERMVAAHAALYERLAAAKRGAPERS
jgi:UDP-glucose:(heptosyl)LPS alpha-1,3-glucosyltransferase